MTYSRGFEYKIMSEWFKIRRINKNIIKDANKISSEAKKYLEFCKTFALRQIIKSPTRVTPEASTLINHILTNTNEKMSQCGLINIGLYDHQTIFCTRKIKKEKVGGQNKFHLDLLKTIRQTSRKRLWVKLQFQTMRDIIIQN